MFQDNLLAPSSRILILEDATEMLPQNADKKLPLFAM
jgi:hypothetical protein